MRRVVGMDIDDCSPVYALSPTMASGGGSGGGGGTGGLALGASDGCDVSQVRDVHRLIGGSCRRGGNPKQLVSSFW